jgi:hypothetical protein
MQKTQWFSIRILHRRQSNMKPQLKFRACSVEEMQLDKFERKGVAKLSAPKNSTKPQENCKTYSAEE